MGGALIVYFFLHANVLSGSMLPNTSKIGLDIVPYPRANGIELISPNSDLALLIIWSFIAGFSERLVPGILAATETSFENAARGERVKGRKLPASIVQP